MTDYNVKFTDTGKTPLLVAQDSQKDSGTDLVLFGRSFLEYGEQLNENLLRLLENFACAEEAGDTGLPNLGDSGGVLSEPVEGQLWYNLTRKGLFQFDGTTWIALANGNSYAANWGQIADGAALPNPVSSDGYVFPYSECIWIVSPKGHDGRFDYMVCATDTNAVVNSKYRLLGDANLTSGNANYLIIGIRGNANTGLITVSAPVFQPTPTPTITPSATVGSTPTPTPTITPTLSNPAASPDVSPTPAPSAGVTPTPTRTVTPTPTLTRTPTPTPSAVAALSVNIVDSARGGAYVDSVSICDMTSYSSVLDTGNVGCTTTLGNCSTGNCAPEPGDYVSGDAAIGAAMGITVTGGIPPYTVRFKNFTATSGSAEFAASGDCLFVGGSAGFSTIPSGTVYTFVIPSNGGSASGITINASCGAALYALYGNFTVEVTDAASHVTSSTFPYAVQREQSYGGGGGGGGCFIEGTKIQMASGAAKYVQNLKVGDVVRSYTVPGMIDEAAYRWADWETDSIEGLAYTESVVRNNVPFVAMDKTTVNGITTTSEHMYFTRRGEVYGWRKAKLLVVGDKLITRDGEWNVTQVTEVTEEGVFYLLDVEENDTLVCVTSDNMKVLSHNLKCADCGI